MPCSECSQTLVYEHSRKYLYCPACFGGLPVGGEEVAEKAEAIRDQFLNHSELLILLEEYGLFRVVASLLQELNAGAAGMTEENRMQFKRFLHPNFLVQQVYDQADRFDHHFDPDNADVQDELEERIDELLRADTMLITILKQIQEDSAVPVELTPGHGDWRSFFGNYDFQQSEYWLCSERCLRSTVGGREMIREEFLEHQDLFRDFEEVQSVTDRDAIETVAAFGDFWYEFIVSLGFAATLQESLQDVFTTQFPDHVSIFDLEALFNRVDDAVSDQLQARQDGDHRSLSLDEDEFDACGRDVFGDAWSDVKPCVLVTEDNTDAHPLFFKVSGTEAFKLPNWRQAKQRPFTIILYPDYFSLLLKFQIYPLLQNGDAPSSAEVLADLTAKRGHVFERNIHNYLRDKEIQSYHSCKTAKQNGNEIDVIFAYNETVYFTEIKFVLPTLNMQAQRGIRDVNATFDNKIFKEDGSSGKPFPDKIDAWLSLEPGAEISRQAGREQDDRVHESLQVPWQHVDHVPLVVSNFVPSYIEKQGVRFLTDLEFYQWIEYGEDVFYKGNTPSSVMNSSATA